MYLSEEKKTFSFFCSFSSEAITILPFNDVINILLFHRELKRFHSHLAKIKSLPLNRCYHIFHRWMQIKRPKSFFHRTFKRIYYCWKSKKVRLISNLALFTWKPVKNVTMKCWVMVSAFYELCLHIFFFSVLSFHFIPLPPREITHLMTFDTVKWLFDNRFIYKMDFQSFTHFTIMMMSLIRSKNLVHFKFTD